MNDEQDAGRDDESAEEVDTPTSESTSIEEIDLDLESLLAESLQASKAGKLKKARNKLESHWKNGKEAVELRRLTHKLEREVEWRPIAAIALFSEQVCSNCNTRHRHFEGLFQQQQHKRDGSFTRFVRAVDHTMTDNLPKFQKIFENPADMCCDCVTTQGWPSDLSYTNQSSEVPNHGSWSPKQNRAKYTDEYIPARGTGRPRKASPLE